MAPDVVLYRLNSYDCLSENKPVFVTDGQDFYKVALLNHYGLQIEYPKTGKRGRPKKPKIFPSDGLKYAQVVKKRKGGKLQKVEKNVIFGEDIEQSAISTSLIERQNLTSDRTTTEFREKQ